MPTFAEAMQVADATGAPAVEGFAVQLKPGAAVTEVVAAATVRLDEHLPGYGWTAENLAGAETPTGWLVFRSRAGELPPPPLGQAWEAVRGLKAIPGVAGAEPQLLVRLPVTNGSDAQRAFQLWGRVSDERLSQIQAASGKEHRHWSLETLRVYDPKGAAGAWDLWKAKHGDRPPGDGILVAHPDTGYTRHPRLLPHLQPHADEPSLYGRNFVERAQPDGLDPLDDRSLASFPGHGTGTASVIAAGSDDPAQPWGVAPGARILPLRVSSSVIHLSFQNLCDALGEAMRQKAHVVSMSLGGPVGSGLLSALVRRALDQGVILVSAAGNNAPTVVFPALLPGVLACAASNALEAPWRFSGLGGAVAITAPGELVWHDATQLGSGGLPAYDQTSGNGTSFATAHVAGLAALWLSYHGRDALIAHCGKRPDLLPFLFRLCLQRSSDPAPKFIRKGKGGFGAGIAQADRLLRQALPERSEVADLREKILAKEPDGIVSFPVSSWWTILTLPTLTADGPVFAETVVALQDRSRRLNDFLTGDKGLVPKAVPDPNRTNLDDTDRTEIGALAGADLLLLQALTKVVAEDADAVSAAVRRHLLRQDSLLSSTLKRKLSTAQEAAQEAWRKRHPELGTDKAYRLPSSAAEEKRTAYSIALPTTRRLRAFAFDPSLATRSSGAELNEITIPVVFERDLKPGPVGDYLEIVDVDPASDCAYAPVDLNHPFLLAQDGLPRSEGNPQFHQQMVYAVAMKTISHFEEALGRPIFWSPLRPWDPFSGDRERALLIAKRDSQGKVLRNPQGEIEHERSDRFIQRLRLYPHALRAQNAYYSPQKRAILFGYFPAGDADPGAEYPGGAVFSCLSHDIIAHETTHAILDGMHVRFTEPTNPDVFAFHEAFADIVALFQRFTYPDLLRDQIARARGRLDAGTLMTRLALQFGQATGRHQALRDALGHVVRQGRSRAAAEWRDLRDPRPLEEGSEPPITIANAARDFDDETRYLWKRFQADPSLLAEVEEPHARGSFLVAAVFDAYLTIYDSRVADLKRIATGGTGVLPDGDLHPDLVHRMALEAARSAGHVLRICIRAMDYVPPIDITFGEFLRALITADSDLVPDDDRRYRVAFIEAFRKWGIYPRDVRTLSEETLRWSSPTPKKKYLFDQPKRSSRESVHRVRRALMNWQPGEARRGIFDEIKAAQRMLHRYIQVHLRDEESQWQLLGGIDTTRDFQVTNLRPARRIGPRGEFLTEMVVEILQDSDALPSDEPGRSREKARQQQELEEWKGRGEVVERDRLPFRGGVTLIVGMEKGAYVVRYAIRKNPKSASRKARQHDFLLREGAAGSLDAAEYSSDGLPEGWRSEPAKLRWLAGRVNNVEDMRASSCDCRRTGMDEAEERAEERLAKKTGSPVPNPLAEPFALLHRA